ncbi:disease resistance protein (CC-NBS-LRR class) family protein [Senna tora]|uniref:Disease resistance protein (CC-NBS-LRR class) family protein n=1 Tax=Senna tora TaxID=362788 RepID=A0A834XH89_9FABA|nr:disease resistance protein (CC-NBS-LRR class) family protein [Senna tora]
MTLDVSLCEALQIFSFGHLDSQQTIGVGEADLPVLQALFHVEKVPSNLTDLSLNEKDAMRILNGHCEKNLFTGVETLDLQYFQETPIMFLNDFLEKFPNTTRLLVRNSSFDTLFPSDKIGQCSNESPTQIKCLWLFDLKQLKNIWNDDSVPDSLVQNLKFLSVLGCSSLMRLAPPSISFTNLNILHAIGCKGLIYLMTSLTARSLVHLEYLMIENCEMIEDVEVEKMRVSDFFSSCRLLKTLPGASRCESKTAYSLTELRRANTGFTETRFCTKALCIDKTVFTVLGYQATRLISILYLLAYLSNGSCIASKLK